MNVKRPNETDLEYKKRVLDAISPSFCGAKWYNATIWLGSGQTTSCHHPPAHKADIQIVKFNPKAIHNTPQKKEDRRKMLAGERPSGCEYCWKIEDMGVDAVSDRPYKSMTYTEEALLEATRTPVDQDVDLQTLEIAFDRTCQFACSYCNPAFSTTWVKDIKKNGPYVNLVTDGRGHFTHVHEHDQLFDFHETNPYIEAFFAWWESDLHRTLKELRITGGEPLMSGHTWKLFDWFKANKNKSTCQLAINSNLGFGQDVVQRMLDSTEGVKMMLYTSNESVGPHAEYIRDGLEWSQWISNMEFLLKAERMRLSVMMTINALCLESLPEMLDQVMAWKKTYGQWHINFSLNILRFPSFQSALTLPDHVRQEYNKRLAEWYELNRGNPDLNNFEKSNIERLIDYLDIVKTPHGEGYVQATAQKDFKQFYEQYDVRRGKDFRKTFSPMLVEWYESI
jgi:organic radical activating enzyme